MPASKVVNADEVKRWIEEGRTYQWMVEEYARKYNIETVPSMFGNLRRRWGLDRRLNRDDDLVPWLVREEHRWHYAARMLRAVARKRAGLTVAPVDERRLENFIRNREEEGTVVHYDPDTEEGFFYVPRREGIDLDLIREPTRKTTTRPRAD